MGHGQYGKRLRAQSYSSSKKAASAAVRKRRKHLNVIAVVHFLVAYFSFPCIEIEDRKLATY
jgi:uncharacterized membrane protein (DUF485 family)